MTIGVLAPFASRANMQHMNKMQRVRHVGSLMRFAWSLTRSGRRVTYNACTGVIALWRSKKKPHKKNIPVYPVLQQL